MPRILIPICLCGLLLLSVPGLARTTVADVTLQVNSFYASVTELLQRHVANGEVKYKDLQQDVAALDRLVKQIESYDLSKAAADEKKAFYINAYNVLVLKQVMEHYPIKSVMDVPGFFDKRKFKVAGESLTLNELENKKLRAPFKDARIHFALVCAAKSCPPLLNRAFTPQQVEGQLEAQTRLALQDAAFTRVFPAQKQVQVSELFKWYEEDFLAEAPTILAYVNKYRTKPIPRNYQVGFYTYNWALNEPVK